MQRASERRTESTSRTILRRKSKLIYIADAVPNEMNFFDCQKRTSEPDLICQSTAAAAAAVRPTSGAAMNPASIRLLNSPLLLIEGPLPIGMTIEMMKLIVQ